MPAIVHADSKRSLGIEGSRHPQLKLVGQKVPNTKKQRIHTSPSILSLRSLRRSPTLETAPIISQPTLDHSSHEKVRNKIRQSPSMLSINKWSGQTELHSTEQRRQNAELLQFCPRGRVERCVDESQLPPASRVINLSHSSAFPVLQELKITRILTSQADISGFALYGDVRLITAGSSHGSLISMRDMPSKSITPGGDGSEEAGDASFESINSTHSRDSVSIYSRDSRESLFCTLQLPDLGEPLAKLALEGPGEAWYVLLAVTRILARAEAAFQFEHRHLHAGNIMVDRDPRNGQISRVTLVGCGLSRLTNPGTGTVYYTPLDCSEFYQPRLPVLALMRAKVIKPANFVPGTNVMWLVYLAKYLHGRTPSAALKRAIENLSPSWGGLRKAPKSAQEALDRLDKR